jgi:hypothetical protein
MRTPLQLDVQAIFDLVGDKMRDTLKRAVGVDLHLRRQDHAEVFSVAPGQKLPPS